MSRKDKDNTATKHGDLNNLQLELKIMEAESFGWLISSSYRNYDPEINQKKLNRSKKNKFNNIKKRSI